MSRRTLLRLTVGVALIAGGVACVVLGLQTHPAIKVGGIVLPPGFVRQVGALHVDVEHVRVGRDAWQIVAGALLSLDGVVVVVVALRWRPQRQPMQ